jgi:hypothetical protein
MTATASAAETAAAIPGRGTARTARDSSTSRTTLSSSPQVPAPSGAANTPIATVRASEPPTTSAARTCTLGRRPGHSSAAQASGPDTIGSQLVQR